MGAVKTSEQRVRTGLASSSASLADSLPVLPQELTMADVAFVVITIAVFALVAFIAKGVAKL